MKKIDLKKDCTIMLPVSRSNIQLTNNCIRNLLETCELNIIVIDENLLLVVYGS